MARTGNHTKRSRSAMALCVAALVVAAALSLGACRKEGAGQKAGEAIDNAKDKVADTLNPKGPLEKAGRSVDRATGN
jgi:hypothetical protein